MGKRGKAEKGRYSTNPGTNIHHEFCSVYSTVKTVLRPGQIRNLYGTDGYIRRVRRAPAILHSPEFDVNAVQEQNVLHQSIRKT